MILAVWVLLQFIDKVEPMAHYPATYPSQIFFLKEDIGYEIVVLYDGEQHLARLLQPQGICGTSLSCLISVWRRNWCCRMSPACLPP